MAVIINGVSYAPKCKISVIAQFASSIGKQFNEIIALLEIGDPTVLVGLLTFAIKREGNDISEQTVWDEVDDRLDFLADIATYVGEQLIPKTDAKKKGTQTKKK